MISATEALLPCPICGGEARLAESRGFYWVTCVECCASGPTTGKRMAVELWNNRPDAGSRYAELFGTPERMARFIIERCGGDCIACPMPDDCPCRASYAADEDDYGPVLEWLRGDAE